MRDTSAELDFSRASNVVQIKVVTRPTSGFRQPPTATPTPVWARSLEMIMRYLCAANATCASTRLAKRIFGKIATPLDGRGHSTKSAGILTQRMRLLKQSRRHFGLNGSDW